MRLVLGVICAAGCAALLSADAEPGAAGYVAAAAWQPKTLNGRSFIPFAPGNFPRWSEPDWDSELRALPLFADMGFGVGVGFGNLQDVYRKGFGWKNENVFLRPDAELRKTPYTMTELMGIAASRNARNLLARGVFEDGNPIAFSVGLHDGRPAAFLHDGYLADRAEYASWKARHPGFIGFRLLTEYDNDIFSYNANVETITNDALRTRLLSRLPVARTGKEKMAQLRTVVRREQEMCFGETERPGRSTRAVAP